MVYGDGDGVIFTRFTKSVDVVGHELTHGVVQFTSALEYFGESGALNEHFADVFGTLVKQYRRRQTAKSADWLIGKEILVPAPTRTALRSMKAPGTGYQNDPDLGDDPQPSHYRDRYRGSADNGGVHINSGIANHAFYLAIEGGTNRTSGLGVQGVGGASREQIERVFYRAFTQLMPANATFATARAATIQASVDLFGGNSAANRAVTQAWTAVGVN
jgi:Zn-dependent metalloprotease